MSAIVIAGDTSGTITLQAPAVAGSTVITLPTSNTTLLGVGQSANTNVLYNDSAAANGSASFTFNKTTSALTVNGTITASNATIAIIANSSGVYAGNSTLTLSPTISVANASGNVQTTPIQVSVSNATSAVFTANISTITWLPNTYNFGTTNAAGNGYCFLPGGVMFQWGTVSANSSVGNVLFSTNTGAAFPTNLWSAVVTSGVGTVGNTTQGNFAVITTANSTQISIRTANATAATVRWMAIGN